MAVPPATWLHGNHSRRTAGAACGSRRTVCACMAMLAHSMCCVRGTILGTPVEPEVNRNLPMVCGVIAATDSATAAVTGVPRMSAQRVATPPAGAWSTQTTATSSSASACSAAANAVPFWTRMTAGCACATMPRSLEKSRLSKA